MKKKIIIVSALAIVLIVGGIAVYHSDFGIEKRLDYAWSHRTYDKNFDANKKSFQILAEYVLLHKELQNKYGFIGVDYDIEKGKPYLYAGDGTEILWSEEMTEHLQNVLTAIEDTGIQFSSMRVLDNNMVRFLSIDEDYAFVYSKDNTKPTFVRWQDKEDNYKYYVKKLADHWYSITGSDYS